MHGLPNQMVVGFANLVTMEELEEMTGEHHEIQTTVCIEVRIQALKLVMF